MAGAMLMLKAMSETLPPSSARLAAGIKNRTDFSVFFMIEVPYLEL
jgi:hypothetical protein